MQFGDGTGSFRATVSYEMDTGGSNGVALSDLNNDGILDIVTLGTDGVSLNGTLTTRFGRADGTFGVASSVSANWGSGGNASILVYDYNRDGFPDVVYAGNSGIVARMGTGTGAFRAEVNTSGPAVQMQMQYGDINGDGIGDIVGVSYTGANGWAAAYFGRADGTFQAGVTVANSEPLDETYTLGLGDFNGDGRLDLAMGGLGGSAQIFLGNGNGTFRTGTSFVVGSASVSQLLVADINSDGVQDIVAGGGSGIEGTVNTYLGNGNGTFSLGKSYSAANIIVSSILSTDLNNDGVIDLIAPEGTYSFVSVLLGDSTTGVGPLMNFSMQTQADSKQALSMLNKARERLSLQQSVLGAFASRLYTGSAVLSIASENYAGAESRIRDADIAVEAAALTRNSILQRAASAILSQANVQPSLALSLLR